MTPLRKRMIRAMELHRLTQATKDAYLHAIVQLAKFHSRSPDQLSAEEVRFVRILESFLKRFLCHVLPERFMRIRHYGFLANRYRREKLGRIRCLLGVPPRERLETPATVEWLAALLGIDLARCPCPTTEGCGVTSIPFPRRGSQRSSLKVRARSSPASCHPKIFEPFRQEDNLPSPKRTG